MVAWMQVADLQSSALYVLVLHFPAEGWDTKWKSGTGAMKELSLPGGQSWERRPRGAQPGPGSAIPNPGPQHLFSAFLSVSSSSEYILYFPADLRGDIIQCSFTHLHKFCITLSKANASHHSGGDSFKAQLDPDHIKKWFKLALILIVNGATESSLNLLAWFEYK